MGWDNTLCSRVQNVNETETKAFLKYPFWELTHNFECLRVANCLYSICYIWMLKQFTHPAKHLLSHISIKPRTTWKLLEGQKKIKSGEVSSQSDNNQLTSLVIYLQCGKRTFAEIFTFSVTGLFIESLSWKFWWKNATTDLRSLSWQNCSRSW